MYELGQGVPQDPAAARMWYRRAASKGYLPAQNNLGRLSLSEDAGAS
jgi:TPR repeat protein